MKLEIQLKQVAAAEARPIAREAFLWGMHPVAGRDERLPVENAALDG